MERSGIESLEAELQSVREQQENDRLLREQELQQRIDRNAETISENFKGLRTGLSDIAELVHERNHSAAAVQAALDARWAEKDDRHLLKERKQEELLSLIARVTRSCDEMKERADEDRASSRQRHEEVVQLIRAFRTPFS